MTANMVFLHGWGTHPVIWEPLLPHFPAATALPLPGYAGTPSAQSLDQMAEAVAQTLRVGSTLIGWSLGGLVAMRLAARYPEKISRLVLIGATPCFVNREDWTNGVEDAVFGQFAHNLAQDYAGTIRRFLSLQALGSDEAKVVLAALRKRLLAETRPELAVLVAGLTALRHSDLRSEAAALRLPVTLIHGTGDKLAPVGAARWLRMTIPGASLHEVKGAGHAPFLSHVDEVARVIQRAIV